MSVSGTRRGPGEVGDVLEMSVLLTKPASTWSAFEVGKWMDWLEMSEYKRAMLENLVDGKELLELTEEDMVSLGIVRLGHRKTLVRKIAALRAGGDKKKAARAATADSDSDSTGSGSGSASGAGAVASSASTTSSSGGGASDISFKVSYRDTIKIITMKLNKLSLTTLQTTARNEFSGRTLDFLYKDADGDNIQIRSDGDLQSAVKDTQSRGANYVRLEASRGKSSSSSSSSSKSSGGRSRQAGVRAEEMEVLDAMLDAVIIIEPSGTVLFMNKAAVTLFGWDRLSIEGQNVKLLMPDDIAAKHDGYLDAYMRTGRANVIGRGRKVVAKRRNGSTFPVWLSLSETKSRSRHTFTGTIQDLTGRESLFADTSAGTGAEQLSGHYSFMDNLLDPGIVIDARGQVLFANAATERAFGWKKEEMVGKNVKMLMNRDDAAKHDGYLNRYLATGVPHVIGSQREVLAMAKDGALFRVSLALTEQKIGECNSLFIGTLRRLDDPSGDATSATGAPAVSVLQQEREVIDNLAVPAIVIDQTGIIQAFNQHAQKIFGYSLVDVVGKNVKMLMTGSDKANHDDYLKNYIATGKAKIIGIGRDVVGQHKSGGMISFRLAVTVRNDGDKKIFTGVLQSL